MTTYTAHFNAGPANGRTAPVDGTQPDDTPPTRLQLGLMAPEQPGVVRLPMFDRADVPYALTEVDGTDAQYQYDA
jgi:hypothetical protein